jgi:hypothetical protein
MVRNDLERSGTVRNELERSEKIGHGHGTVTPQSRDGHATVTGPQAKKI